MYGAWWQRRGAAAAVAKAPACWLLHKLLVAAERAAIERVAAAESAAIERESLLETADAYIMLGWFTDPPISLIPHYSHR